MMPRQLCCTVRRDRAVGAQQHDAMMGHAEAGLQVGHVPLHFIQGGMQALGGSIGLNDLPRAFITISSVDQLPVMDPAGPLTPRHALNKFL